MNRLILDTSYLIGFERSGVAAAESVLDEDDAVIPAVVAAELEVGVHLASDSERPRRRAWVDGVLDAFEVVPYDLSVARQHGRLIAHTTRTGRPRGRHDLIVAATAASTGRAVVTMDEGAFDDLPGVARLSRPMG